MQYLIKKEILILILCLFIGFVFRFYSLEHKSLWMDEVHTFNDSRFGLRDQIKFYKDNPTYLHPPLFFILTHLLYPFEKPERDLRIIPFIFGTLSIPMIYLLSKQFSSAIKNPCTVALTFMTYHIYVSQDGRSYSTVMFLGMAGLYFFMSYLKFLKKKYLFLTSLFYAIQFHISYSSIPFIIFSQLLWFYKPNERFCENENKKPFFVPFLSLNCLLLIFCLPWTIFILINYKNQIIMDPFHSEGTGSLFSILAGIFYDWISNLPLVIISIFFLIIFLIISEIKKNAIILLGMIFFPILGLYLFCKLFDITHFVTSRYFINFLPIFLITLLMSINISEIKFKKISKFIRFRLMFVMLLIISNLFILPLYYRSEKQDFRGLANYLKKQLRNGDKIFVETTGFIPGILHYLEIYPENRHHTIPFFKLSETKIEYMKHFNFKNLIFSINYSKNCCTQYVQDGSRLWIVAGKATAKKIKEKSPAVLKGFFDGSFLNFNRFPTDASMYLFLWDPNSPNEKGIDMPIE